MYLTTGHFTHFSVILKILLVQNVCVCQFVSYQRDCPSKQHWHEFIGSSPKNGVLVKRCLLLLFNLNCVAGQLFALQVGHCTLMKIDCFQKVICHCGSQLSNLLVEHTTFYNNNKNIFCFNKKSFHTFDSELAGFFLINKSFLTCLL